MSAIEITKEYQDIINKVQENVHKFRYNNPHTLVAAMNENKIVILENDSSYNRDAFIDFCKIIYIKQHVIDAYKYGDDKEFIYGAITHELVHANQHRNIFTFLYYKIFRNVSESQARNSSAEAEKWIVENCEL